MSLTIPGRLHELTQRMSSIQARIDGLAPAIAELAAARRDYTAAGNEFVQTVEAATALPAEVHKLIEASTAWMHLSIPRRLRELTQRMSLIQARIDGLAPAIAELAAARRDYTAAGNEFVQAVEAATALPAEVHALIEASTAWLLLETGVPPKGHTVT